MEKKMQTDQFAEFAAAVVQSLPRDMDTVTGQGWIRNRDALAKVLRQALSSPVMQESKPPLLTIIGIIKVRLLSKFFKVVDHFFVNTEKNAPVKFCYIAPNFMLCFRPSSSSTGVPGNGLCWTADVQETVLHYHTLDWSSEDSHIIDQLGGEAKVETTIPEIYALLERQGNGEDGALLTNGHSNIFYVREASSIRGLCAVGVYWVGDGWNVFAHSVAHEGLRSAGHRVFSH